MGAAAYGGPDWAHYLPFVIPLVIIAAIMRRNLRPRPLRLSRLWISPLLVLVATGLVLTTSPPALDPLSILFLAASGLVGAMLGWYRGRLTRMTVDPATHAITVQVSPIGNLFILAIFAVRYGLRSMLTETPSWLHLSSVQITDALLVLAAGLVCAQRAELWLRAQQMKRDMGPPDAGVSPSPPASGPPPAPPAPRTSPPIVQ